MLLPIVEEEIGVRLDRERFMNLSGTPSEVMLSTLVELLSLLEKTLAIFQEPALGKFVQFGTSEEGEELTLDLLLQALNGGELERARVVFRENGVEEPEGEIAINTLTMEPYQQTGLKLQLGRNASKGADVARRLFREVYLTPDDFKVQVIRGGSSPAGEPAVPVASSTPTTWGARA